MPPRLSWSNLLPGLGALAVIALITVGILMFAGVGKMRGDTTRLYVVTDQAQGVMHGTEVWLLGQKVGVVDGVSFRAPGPDTAGRVVIALDVRAADARQIRRDAWVAVRAGANVVGPVVVYVGAGDAASPPVHDGDTLRARPQVDVQTATTKLEVAAADFPALLEDAHSVVNRLHDRRGSIGAMASGDAMRSVARLRDNVSRARAGPVGGAPEATARVAALRQAASVALGHADTVRALIRSDRASLGRFRRDSTLLRTIAAVRAELATARAMYDTSGGTLARWRTDSAIVRAIAGAQREMALLFDDVRRRPIRYLPF